MEETAPQRYELPNAPPNKALIFLPWKSKGDTKRRQGSPPSRSQKHYIHHPSRFFNFSFSTTSTAPTLSASTPTEVTETPVFTPQNRVAVNYATHRKKTPKTPNMSLIWVLPRVTETSQTIFYRKTAVFFDSNCVNFNICVFLPSELN